MADVSKKKVRWWVCGEGHLFSNGEEDWHYEEHADQGHADFPVPRYSPCDFPDDHPQPRHCRVSVHGLLLPLAILEPR